MIKLENQANNQYKKNLKEVSLLPNLIIGLLFAIVIAGALYFTQGVLLNIFSSWIFR